MGKKSEFTSNYISCDILIYMKPFETGFFNCNTIVYLEQLDKNKVGFDLQSANKDIH